MLVTIIGDLHPPDRFHHEIGPTRFGCSSIEHPRNIRMVHQRQRLALRLEPGHDLSRIHAQLDDLEGHAPSHGFLLLRHEHHPAAAFTNLLQQFVAAYPRAHGVVSRPA
jgi:hypothetical protein